MKPEFMLSERKVLLRACEGVAWLGAASCLLLAFRWGRWIEAGPAIEPTLMVGFVLLLLTFLPACVLAEEYGRSRRGLDSVSVPKDGLTLNELAELLTWAPTPCKVAACLGIVLAVYAALEFGEVGWSSMDPPSAADGVGAALYLATFFMLALPVLASAARMPGSYAESLGHGR
ncbi:hypothetical protein [Roseateles sp.]|jgi:hypothetical protein|uniref:hypothetical protein n=1 Tax=Roseateles sp. TaxID=1971397 RepID=UPI00391B5F3D